MPRSWPRHWLSALTSIDVEGNPTFFSCHYTQSYIWNQTSFQERKKILYHRREEKREEKLTFIAKKQDAK